MSGGGGGSSTPSVQSQSTLTDLPAWYKDLTQQLGGILGSQFSNIAPVSNNFLQGGTAPSDGVFNGGATHPPITPPIQPQGAGGPMMSGNSMGSGIGSPFTEAKKGVLQDFAKNK